MEHLFKYIKLHLFAMSVGLVIKLVGTVADLLIPRILAHMLDNVTSVRLILLWGGAMLLSAAIALVTNIIANRMASKVARDITEQYRHDLFVKVLSLSCRQVDEHTIASLESRITSDTYHVHQMIGMMQRMGVRAPILLIGGIAMTITMEPVLTLTLLCVLPLVAWLTIRVSQKGVPLYRKVQQSYDRLTRTVRENISGIRVTKALSQTDYEKERFAQSNTHVVEQQTKADNAMALTHPLMGFILNGGLVLAILVGAFRVNAGASHTGQIIAFITYFIMIFHAMLGITRIFTMYTRGSASANRIADVMNTAEQLQPTPMPKHTGDDHIVFDHVSFSYAGKKDNVSDICVSVKRGGTLGIIGETGSGKSTLLQLLMRFYDADKGEIYIGANNVKSIPPEVLHNMFGVVFQNDVLFADTIFNNIDFGRNLPAEQIALAAECAQANEFIDHLPDGMDHMLTERGSNLSGGQKQRLLIARALAGNPEILMLDESSSALDFQTDALLRKAIREHYSHITTILVAQRVSSIAHADRILVLEQGRAVGYDTHQNLLKTCETYREISQLQTGGGDVA